MANEKILIVGAGAGGIVTGYYLTESGADVTFYVRPERQQSAQPPKQLYSYDDNTLRTYTEFQVISDTHKIADTSYDYVLVTLDGSAAFSEDGSELLRQLGAAVDNSSAVFICLGVGVGIWEHYIECTGLPGDRILTGTFYFLSHQTPLEQPPHGDREEQALAAAEFAYRNFGGKGGLTLGNRNKKAARKFAAIYDRNGYSKCALVPQDVAELIFSIVFPLFIVSELAGWPEVPELVENKKLWTKGWKTANEIASLSRFGLIGRVFSWVMRESFWKKLWLRMDAGAVPLDFNSFNRFHHGGKVVAQDTRILRDLLEAGKASGREMPHLSSLLAEIDSFRSA